ncbi:MAG: ribonuclease HI, partial [Alistipes sp.]|nr:ribonuclease HI [Alistipes sp.]
MFTDGACKGNPGKGGWGVLLRYGKAVKELSGYEEMTTNNRMELTAVIQALLALKEPCKVTLTTDSQYVVNGIVKGWAKSWRENGWRNAKRQAVANPDLWEELLPM